LTEVHDLALAVWRALGDQAVISRDEVLASLEAQLALSCQARGENPNQVCGLFHRVSRGR